MSSARIKTMFGRLGVAPDADLSDMGADESDVAATGMLAAGRMQMGRSGTCFIEGGYLTRL